MCCFTLDESQTDYELMKLCGEWWEETWERHNESPRHSGEAGGLEPAEGDREGGDEQRHRAGERGQPVWGGRECYCEWGKHISASAAIAACLLIFENNLYRPTDYCCYGGGARIQEVTQTVWNIDVDTTTCYNKIKFVASRNEVEGWLTCSTWELRLKPPGDRVGLPEADDDWGEDDLRAEDEDVDHGGHAEDDPAPASLGVIMLLERPQVTELLVKVGDDDGLARGGENHLHVGLGLHRPLQLHIVTGAAARLEWQNISHNSHDLKLILPAPRRCCCCSGWRGSLAGSRCWPSCHQVIPQCRSL